MSNALTSLYPGYKHVDAFSPDEDYEDEEVTYVTLDLGNIEPTLVPSSSTYRLIGLDSPTPFLQLSGTILKGRHDALLGTELLFTEDKETHDWNKRSLIHVASTEQRICFKEVRLQPKAESLDGLDDEDELIAMAVEPDPNAEAEKIDRLTGKSVPISRAVRGKGKSEAKKRKSAKGKGKERRRDFDTDDDADDDVLEDGPEGRDDEEPMQLRRSARRRTTAKGKEKDYDAGGDIPDEERSEDDAAMEITEG